MLAATDIYLSQSFLIKRIILIIIISFGSFGYELKAQISYGHIIDNTNAALPASYNFKEYVFGEPEDEGSCTGQRNATAAIQEVFISQTHRHAIDHPLFFMIGERPALFQVAVTGSGISPDVRVEGKLNGNSLGFLCLKGPATLPEFINLEVPDFEDYFSVTLPKSWVKNGLELVLSVSDLSRTISSEELKIGPYTEMNLVMVYADVLDYNITPTTTKIFDAFLEEVASSIPASVIRFGIFPETLRFPEIIATNGSETLVRLKSKAERAENGITSDGSINSIITQVIKNLHKSTHDYLSTVYFGNTLNLNPGGWGGGKSFVAADYTRIFIHELGHALSLPHWGDAYNPTSSVPNRYNYPYGGIKDNGGGHGPAWNFIQNTYEFESPFNEDPTRGELGLERSDCMQRANAGSGLRPSGFGPWDGFGDFSAYAMYRYLVGASEAHSGTVDDIQAVTKNFNLRPQNGFPNMTLNNDGIRIYTRDELQPEFINNEQKYDWPRQEQLNADAYLIYGSIHDEQEQVNIVYKPIKFNGTIPPIIDPTDPVIFEQLKSSTSLGQPRDITLKLTYEDGSILHALNPYHSFGRAPDYGSTGIWRRDLCYFSMVVPGDKPLQKVELYKRSFWVKRDDDSREGNINYDEHNITAENFMDDAVYLTEYDYDTTIKTLGPNSIGNRVWHDLNQNGIMDDWEPGIPGVYVALHKDRDNDGIPTNWGGYRITDDNGYYRFTSLSPGIYKVFIWSQNNWGPGEPLEGMQSSDIYFPNPDNDIDNDNNAEGGKKIGDVYSGIITLTADGEPLNDGDIEENESYDFDHLVI